MYMLASTCICYLGMYSYMLWSDFAVIPSVRLASNIICFSSSVPFTFPYTINQTLFFRVPATTCRFGKTLKICNLYWYECIIVEFRRWRPIRILYDDFYRFYPRTGFLVVAVADTDHKCRHKYQPRLLFLFVQDSVLAWFSLVSSG